MNWKGLELYLGFVIYIQMYHLMYVKWLSHLGPHVHPLLTVGPTEKGPL